MARYEKSEAMEIVAYNPAQAYVNVLPTQSGNAVVLLDHKLESGRFLRIKTGDLLEVIEEGGTVVVARHEATALQALGFSPR